MPYNEDVVRDLEKEISSLQRDVAILRENYTSLKETVTTTNQNTLNLLSKMESNFRLIWTTLLSGIVALALHYITQGGITA